jgi:transglutaminase-like putative cysteine protease
MKTLQFYYTMDFTFHQAVACHHFTLKCLPLSDHRQTISRLSISITPDCPANKGYDSFGNQYLYGYAASPHDQFSVKATGIARTGLANYEIAADDMTVALYKYQSSYTHPGPNLRQYYDQFHFAPAMTNYDRALLMMEKLHDDFSYVQGVTTITTTAEDALRQGRGVCQDYSHILLSLCRLAGIPARYVVGILIGEGLSHAWVEVCQSGLWIGLDPTNNLVVSENHIKISHGRDYKDCIINQGIFMGSSQQSQTISVIAEDISDP